MVLTNYFSFLTFFFSLILQIITDLVDSSLPSICHIRPLPCSSEKNLTVSTSMKMKLKSNENGNENKNENVNYNQNHNIRGTPGSGPSSLSCLSPTLLSKLMQDADQLFCNKYMGKNGGETATKLSSYPFVKEVKCCPIILHYFPIFLLFLIILDPFHYFLDVRNIFSFVFKFSSLSVFFYFLYFT